MTTDITELAQLRAELSNPAIGSKDHLRKLALSLVEALELKEEQRANWFQMAQKLGEDLDAAEKRNAELESRTVKLPDDEDGQAYGFGKWSNGKLPATAGTMTIAYCEDAWRAAFEVFSSAAGIKVEAE